MAGANDEGAVEVKKQASRGLVKEMSWERKEDDLIVDETCPSGGVVSEMTAGFAVAVKTTIVISWPTISEVPWCAPPFQCRPNPRECPLTPTRTLCFKERLEQTVP